MDPSPSPARSEADAPIEPAIIHIPSHLRFWLLSAAMLGLDLWSKHWAFTALRPNAIHPIIPGVIDFRRSLNDGAVFGSFSGYSGVFIVASLFALGFVFYLFAHSLRTQRGLHVSLALILAGAVGNLYDRAYVIADVVTYRDQAGQAERRIGRIRNPNAAVVEIGDYPGGDTNVQKFPKATVTVKQQGVVRDFIKFVPRFPAWAPRMAGQDMWPWVFNVADAALVCGVIVLLLHTLLDRASHARGQSHVRVPAN